MRHQQGFTLIELVMVIVILGILAATALPKFVDLQGDARMSSIKAAKGAIQSASSIAHAASLVANSQTVSIEGVEYTMVNSYPDDTNIATLANLSGDDYNFANADNVLTVTLGTCSFTYTEAASAGAAPATTDITGDTDNKC